MNVENKTIFNWSRTKKFSGEIFKPVNYDELEFFIKNNLEKKTISIMGGGCSYGDCYLNQEGMIIDMSKFDKIIDDIEPGALRMPVLLKKYIKQNARLIAFNVDPLFNNVVDGLIYIRISDIPESTVRPVMEEFKAELERKYGPKKEAIL